MKHTLISVEGTDGCGKKTHIQNLHEYFKKQGKEVIIASFPNYQSPSSGPVKMYLGGEVGSNAMCLDAYQASTLYAVDRLCTMKQIMSTLDRPTVILFDRYVQSNMIHQAGKIENKKQRDKFLKWVDNFEFNVLKLPRPNKIIFLNVPPQISIEIAQQRTTQKNGKDVDIHENDSDHLRHAYEAATYVAKKFKWTVINLATDDDTFDSVEANFEKILKEVKGLV
ncbi:MAG: deoxynucleoside kinase [Christensenellaceae bacterium]|jgi:dTMP kinase|nr:deoxynucleoside kinase [Christensenellaceae bacterium]